MTMFGRRKPETPAELTYESMVSARVDGGKPMDVEAKWVYDPLDPFAVTCNFYQEVEGERKEIPWTFGRSVLRSIAMTNTHEVAGQGDVYGGRIDAGHFDELVEITFQSPEATMRVEFDASAIGNFVANMYTVVTDQAATEATLHSVDQIIPKILQQ